MIKGYAYQGDYGRSVNLFIGDITRVGDGAGEYFRPYDFARGGLARTQVVEEGTQAPSVCAPIPLEIAEEIYRALDRIFGNGDETPAIVKETLSVERARVERMLDVLIEIAKP